MEKLGIDQQLSTYPKLYKCGQDTAPVKTSNAQNQMKRRSVVSVVTHRSQHHRSHLSVGVTQPETTPEIVLSGHRQRPIVDGEMRRERIGEIGDRSTIVDLPPAV